ncbi:uncharacterized protein [Ptychodera flava]|uniref:uncharacterized protein n=1 Tax=Ptychodera flava TaxID=63121 RepID=UPI00396A8315
MSQKVDAVVKVILWSAPRCISTAFERSMRTLQDVKVYHEYYCIASYHGEERIYTRYQDDKPVEKFRYGDVKSTLEGAFPQYQGVFLKDMAYAMVGQFDALPAGYRHTFLIRDPTKAITSLYKTIKRGNMPEWSDFRPEEAGFCEMWQLYQHVRDVTGEEPVVIDADDLLSDPAAMMKKYCEAVGLEYTDRMLEWDADDQSEHWTWENAWYGTVSSSTGFIKTPGANAHTAKIDTSSLPEYVQDAIREAQPAYENLFNRRIKVC